MHRINLYIDDSMFKELKELPSTLSENVRQAIYEYLYKLNRDNVSSSESKRKEGK